MAATTVTVTPTAFIPMTTIFTPAPTCSASWTWAPSVYNGYDPGLLVQNVFSGSSDSACWPSGWTQFGRSLDPTIQVFSPGWCPSGYTSAIEALDSVTTVVTCCLSSYSFYEYVGDGTTWQGCMSTLSSTTPTTMVAQPNMTDISQQSLVTSTLDVSIINGANMWAQPVTIAYQEQDVSLFISSSVTGTASTNVATAGAESTISSDAASAEDNSGLSTGAKAGIGVGVALGCIALVGAILFFVIRRRRLSRVGSENAHQPNMQQWPVEIDGEGTQHPVEAPAEPYTQNKKLAPSSPVELQGS